MDKTTLTIEFLETKEKDGTIGKHSIGAASGATLPPGAKPKISLMSANCGGAGGKYSSPTTRVNEVYLQEPPNGPKILGSISQGNGFWSATFPGVPAGIYVVHAVGNDGSTATSVQFECAG
jgi:hypothetical protein